MNITQKFLAFTLLGAQWVLWLLIGLSVISVAIMIERILFYTRRRVDFDLLSKEIRASLSSGEVEGFLKRWAGTEALEVIVAQTGLRAAARGPGAAAEAMIGAKARTKQAFERNLAFLGTLGNNAPFIGLFGTVLGIIKAFHDLAENSSAGAEAIMAGISEALVATAIGLLVAIPAVIAFNFFNRRVRAAVSNSDAIAHLILAELRAETPKEKA